MDSQGELSYKPSEFRLSEGYIRIYRTYFSITVFALLPFLLMAYLNGKIFWTLKYGEIQMLLSNNMIRSKDRILLSIVLTFFVLQLPRVIVDIYEFSLVEEIAARAKGNVHSN